MNLRFKISNMSDNEKRCNFCLKTEKQAKAKIKSCSSCKVIHYCSKKCQINDWPIHNKVCKTLKHDVNLVLIKSDENGIKKENFNVKVKQGNNSWNLKSKKTKKKK